MSKNVKPVVPVDFIYDFFKHCGTECLQQALVKGPNTAEQPAVDGLYQAIRWANDLKREADENGGRLSRETNDTAVNCLLAGWDALRSLNMMS